jgi:hypothetical protein
VTKPEALPIVARLTQDDGVTWQNLTDHTTATAQLAALQAEVERLRADTERLSILEDECLTLECESGVEDDVHWSVYSYHTKAPCKRLEACGNTPRAAIDAALLARKGE